ncbi:hypothetical protein GN956_G7129 [Arapaima gigas]
MAPVPEAAGHTRQYHVASSDTNGSNQNPHSISVDTEVAAACCATLCRLARFFVSGSASSEVRDFEVCCATVWLRAAPLETRRRNEVRLTELMSFEKKGRAGYTAMLPLVPMRCRCASVYLLHLDNWKRPKLPRSSRISANAILMQTYCTECPRA